jgi:hypothetical protein
VLIVNHFLSSSFYVRRGAKNYLIHIVQSISIFISNKKKRGCVRVERGSTISYIIYIGGAIRFLPSANRNNWICSQLPGNKLFFSGTLISLVRPWVCKAERERGREWCVMCALLTPPSPLWMYYSVSNLSITLPQFFVSSGSSGNIKRLGETRRKGEDPSPLHQKHALFTRMITRLVGLS